MKKTDPFTELKNAPLKDKISFYIYMIPAFILQGSLLFIFLFGIYSVVLSFTAADPALIPCDTDTDCMEKNPHIQFSLEAN